MTGPDHWMEESPRWRRWGRGLLLALALLVALSLGCRALWDSMELRSLGETVRTLEERWGRLHPSTMAPPEVSPSLNAARIFRAAADLVHLEMADRKILTNHFLEQIDRWSLSGLVEDQGEAVRSILARNRKALDLAVEAAGLAGSNWEIRYDEGIHASLMNLVQLSRLGLLLKVEALLALHDGDDERFVQVTEATFAISRSMVPEPIVLVQMMRNGFESRPVRGLQSFLNLGDGDPGHLRRLLASTEGLGGPEPYGRGVVGEMKAMHQAIREDGSAHPPILVGASEMPDMEGIGSWVGRPIRRAVHRRYLEETSLLAGMALIPRHERPEGWSARSLGAERSWLIGHWLDMLNPNWDGFLIQIDVAQARMAVARTALAVELHRATTGSLPVTLEDLVPGILGAVPVDPFSGGPPGYERLGAGFRVWSAGKDYPDLGAYRPEEKRRSLDWTVIPGDSPS